MIISFYQLQKDWSNINGYLIHLFLLSCFLCVNNLGYCQYNKVSIVIDDTVIYKRKHQDVVKLNVTITNEDVNEDSIIFENFFKIVPSNPFYYDPEPISESSKGNCNNDALFFIIESTNHQIIRANNSHLIQNAIFSDIDSYHSRTMVLDTLYLKYQQKCIQSTSDDNILILKKKRQIIVYADISRYYYLTKGKYYIFLYYCNIFNSSITNIHTGTKISKHKNKFYGTVISNKITLIIK